MRDQVYVGMLVSSDELSHHGILGMKWGVRRYQNKDGTLTVAGKKRYGDKAQNYINRRIKHAKTLAEEHDLNRNLKEYDKKYGGKDGYKKWLSDMYGNDWKNTEYMKRVFEVDDVKKHAEEEMASERKEMKEYYTMMKKVYEDDAKTWQDRLSSTNLKDIKKWAKLEDKEVKRDNRYLKRKQRRLQTGS